MFEFLPGWMWLGIGLVLGASFGIVILGMLNAAKRADEAVPDNYHDDESTWGRQ